MNESEAKAIHNEAARRFEVNVGGERAILEYRRSPGVIDLIHTEVPAALRGRGLGEILVRAALDFARDHKLTVVPTCPYVKAYLQKHPEQTTA